MRKLTEKESSIVKNLGGLKNEMKSYQKNIKKFFFSCSICGSNHFSKIYGVSVFDVCLCCSCGLVCLNPRMDEKGYMEKFIKNYRRDLFGDYLAVSVNPDELYSKATKSPFSNKVFNDLKSHLSNEAKILEVGCGAGDVLILFKKNKFNNLTGIDPSMEYCQSLKKLYGIECYNKSLSEFAGIFNANKKFECIILKDVIEHFVEPDKALKAINNLMTEKGILYITTTDLYKFSIPFSQFCVPHTFYFSRITLENLLLKCGFRIKRYFDNFVSNGIVLLAEKEKDIEQIKYDPSECKRVFAYIKRDKFFYIFFKLKRFIEEIFIKIFGENTYLSTRVFFKNCAIALIKKCKKYKK